ncbi:MAG: Glycine cleavage system transcriptional antiactivator GcvR [Armatimonadetes bacterium]|jgi:glycine cleavage system transcriptional repressor|nr:Glycine cleavage system transcriptional antiactivator GcvR [Armatimonadota bacterium]
MSQEYLVFTALGTDRPGIVADLTQILAGRGLNVADSRMAVLGGEFALMMLVSGAGGQLSEARADVEGACTRLGLQVVIKDTQSPTAHRAGNVRSYEIKVHALDHPGIVHAVTGTLRALGGNVISLNTSAYQAAVTGAPLFEMTVTADFPHDVTAARLRDALDEVSDTANADVEVRPV